MKTPMQVPSTALLRVALLLWFGSMAHLASAQDKPISLPVDFAFVALTKASGSVELLPFLKSDAKNMIVNIGAEGQEATLKNDRDAVAGLHGHGLSVEQTSGRFYWKPESFACYRDGSLLGVWDVKASSFRPASTDEAPVDFTQITLKPKPVEKPAPKIPTEQRVWTDNKGRKIEGRVLNYNVATRMLSLETSSGQVFRNYPMANLSAEDQAYLKSLFPASAQ